MTDAQRPTSPPETSSPANMSSATGNQWVLNAISQLRSDLGGRLDVLDNKIAQVDEKVASTDEKAGDIITAIAVLRERTESMPSLNDGITELKSRGARIEERMDRVMEKAREMPDNARVNSLLNHKLSILGIVMTVVIALAGLGLTYAVALLDK